MTKLWIHFAILCAAALSWSCTEAQTADLPALTPVKVQPVEAYSINDTLRYSATIRPSSQMELAFRNGGFVDSIHRISGRLVDQGDTIAAGTVLARLRQADFQHRLDQANAQLLEARFALESAKARADDSHARLARAEQDYRRAELLFGSQSLTQSSYDAARAEYESARAKVESANADIDSAQSRIRSAQAAVADATLASHDAALIAPMSGTILERSIEPGSLAGAGKRVFVLADTRTVKAVFGVPDLEIERINIGASLTIKIESLPDQFFKGHVTSISPAADEKTRIFETEVTVANPKGLLKSGMIATVSMSDTQDPQELPAVPLSAIVRSTDNPERYAVFVVESGSGGPTAHLRDVTLGDAVGNRIVVKEGLKVGENVISIGTTLVHDGEIVQIVP